jgi:hypothetical protein
MPPPPSGPGPIDEAALAAIARATSALRPARRAERVAGASGWLTLLAGAITLPLAIGSGLGMALGVALIVIGWRELTLRAGLRDLETIAAARLARNQLALAVCLAGYAVAMLLRGPGALPASDALAQSPELAAAADGVMRLAHYGMYAGLLLGAAVVQGSQAAFYARAGKRLRRAHAAHPVWVMKVHRAAWAGTRPPADRPAAPRVATADPDARAAA